MYNKYTVIFTFFGGGSPAADRKINGKGPHQYSTAAEMRQE
jgi:hypothetical protein